MSLIARLKAAHEAATPVPQRVLDGGEWWLVGPPTTDEQPREIDTALVVLTRDFVSEIIAALEERERLLKVVEAAGAEPIRVPSTAELSPEQRKYAIRLLAFGFHQRFPAHEGNPPDSADLLGAENALGNLLREFGVYRGPMEDVMVEERAVALHNLLAACEYVETTHSESCPVFGTGPDQEGPAGPCNCNPGRIGAALKRYRETHGE